MKKFIYFGIIIFTILFMTFLFCFRFKDDRICSDFIFTIKNYKDGNLYKEGMGFVYKVDDYAYILTNYHVISDNDDIFIDIGGNKVIGSVLNYDEYYDIGIIVVDKKYVDNKLNLGSLNDVNYNDDIYIYCELSDNRSVAKLLSKTQSVKFKYGNESKMLDLFKINGVIKEGYSGCPVIDKNNRAIGIITMIVNDGSNDAYVIPIDDIKSKIDILEHERLNHPNLGIVASSYHADINGVIIDEVYDGYPADVANLDIGDIIVSINDISVNDVVEFKYYLYKINRGEKVKIKYYRNEQYYFTYIEL